MDLVLGCYEVCLFYVRLICLIVWCFRDYGDLGVWDVIRWGLVVWFLGGIFDLMRCFWDSLNLVF